MYDLLESETKPVVEAHGLLPLLTGHEVVLEGVVRPGDTGLLEEVGRTAGGLPTTRPTLWHAAAASHVQA